MAYFNNNQNFVLLLNSCPPALKDEKKCIIAASQFILKMETVDHGNFTTSIFDPISNLELLSKVCASLPIWSRQICSDFEVV